MSARNHIIFWCLAFAVFVGAVWLFKGMLLPFVLGVAVAYLLNPIVNRLGGYGLARGPAALVILLTFLLFIGGIIAAVAPIAYDELVQLSKDMPGYTDKIAALAAPLTGWAQDLIGKKNGEELQALLSQHAGTALNVANLVLSRLVAGGQAVVDVISLVVIMPVVAYFMMKEWPKIAAWVVDLIPRHSERTIMGLLKEIDTKISGFVRGQISVAFILAVVYAICLSLAGLKYGFLIGLTSGFLSVIPMVGSAIGLIVSVGVACFQWLPDGEWIRIIAVAGIFIAGQIIEGNILTPKLVGDSVGLHPLWVFFALLAGGSLFGILGMFLAVPVAAVAGVLLAFGIAQYKASAFYKGTKKPKRAKKKKGAKQT